MCAASLTSAPLRRLRCSVRTIPASRRAFSVSRPRDATWGFIGLGQMGYAMAKNLRSKIPAGDTLVIRDIDSDVMKKFVDEVGASSKERLSVEVAGNAREVAEKSEVIITSLPEPSHVKDVFHCILKHGELPPVAQERLFIDCSTIDPASSKEIATAVHSTQAGRFVDAPMSGGVVGARAGTLSFMFGATTKTGQLVERVKPILLLMGKKAWHLGEQGAGVTGKLANNYILAINNIATAEAMNLGIRWGLDPKVLADMINSSTGRCWPSEVNNPVPGVVETAPASRGYTGGFGVSLMKKDLRLAIAAAAESGTPLDLANTARGVYDATEDKYRGKDFSVVYQHLLDKSR
ncbi:putative dehydrogenase [Paecilomyces variotii]|uniref:3-hydroxyisobutyrate dehydrogenase n=1 Tax=Byssochlamys spectabilis TaxID=264951 RepID=A0A443HJY6_BYSSP|nr:putative dehydrogenase [Paecilomyces variotii]KAJ9355115.1 hypothetical protein DTO280E4_6629 [Paecilomyces variotii]RWQ92089.1 putative dehydrogenase [Paecilomyces variotii]